jgi:hypothetical protein
LVGTGKSKEGRFSSVPCTRSTPTSRGTGQFSFRHRTLVFKTLPCHHWRTERGEGTKPAASRRRGA